MKIPGLDFAMREQARPIRRKCRGRPVGGRRHRQQVGEQRHGLVDIERCREQVRLDGGPARSVVRMPCLAKDRLSQLVGDRVERTLGVKGRALQFDHPTRRVLAGFVDDDARKTGLADAGFTADADDLSLS
jgi:hypothetical protein